ncbi:MAG: GNAT family N-acetyltransferase [Myxococcota bacterium]|nr:GNAT family N-acetyltransferase [Myxococcota bacterium]
MSERFDEHTATIRFRIRPCVHGDLEALQWMGVFAAQRETIHGVWAKQLEGRARMLVAEASSFPVGQVWVDLAPAHAATLWALRVLPGLHNAGIGRALVSAAERVAHRAGHERARLSVALDNPGAERLYQRVGYRRVGEQRSEIVHRAHDGSRVVTIEQQIVLEKALLPAGQDGD